MASIYYNGPSKGSLGSADKMDQLVQFGTGPRGRNYPFIVLTGDVGGPVAKASQVSQELLATVQKVQPHVICLQNLNQGVRDWITQQDAIPGYQVWAADPGKNFLNRPCGEAVGMKKDGPFKYVDVRTDKATGAIFVQMEKNQVGYIRAGSVWGHPHASQDATFQSAIGFIDNPGPSQKGVHLPPPTFTVIGVADRTQYPKRLTVLKDSQYNVEQQAGAIVACKGEDGFSAEVQMQGVSDEQSQLAQKPLAVLLALGKEEDAHYMLNM